MMDWRDSRGKLREEDDRVNGMMVQMWQIY